MRLTHVTDTLGNLQADGSVYEDEFLVDTGAIDCLVSATHLNNAGIAVKGKDVYELVNGGIVEYPYDFACVSFMRAETVNKVVLDPQERDPLLGVVVLEITGISVDPAMQALERMSAKPLK